MSVEQAINDFLHVCGSPQLFFASPQLHFTIMVKSLLEKKWASHQATVTAIFNLSQHIISFLQEIGTSIRAHEAETVIEASRLLREVQEQCFLFIAKMLCKVADVLLYNRSYFLSFK